MVGVVQSGTALTLACLSCRVDLLGWHDSTIFWWRVGARRGLDEKKEREVVLKEREKELD